MSAAATMADTFDYIPRKLSSHCLVSNGSTHAKDAREKSMEQKRMSGSRIEPVRWNFTISHEYKFNYLSGCCSCHHHVRFFHRFFLSFPAYGGHMRCEAQLLLLSRNISFSGSWNKVSWMRWTMNSTHQHTSSHPLASNSFTRIGSG